MRIKLFISFISLAIFMACTEEDPKSPDVTEENDPITENRWKSTDLWEDFCQVDDQTFPIQGYEYYTFKTDNSVLYELELTGETYDCDGDSDPAGTWEKVSTNQYIFTDEDGDESEIEIIENGDRIKFTEDDGGIVYFTKE